MDKDPGWELYRSFLAVLREGSLSGAARSLGVTQPTIGRHIQALESALGRALFTRARDGLRPTDAAHAIKSHAETMSAEAAALTRAVAAKVQHRAVMPPLSHHCQVRQRHRTACVQRGRLCYNLPMAPLSHFATRVSYGVTQLARVSWYLGHGFALRQLAASARKETRPQAPRRSHSGAPVPDRDRIYADMLKLFREDLANVEAGLYPVPADHDGPLLHRSRLFFEDLPAIHRRRQHRAHREVLTNATRSKRPSYYLQNFHFQSGGWMTPDSAERYDTQVEVLFKGTANAIRRQALPQLHEVFAGRDQRKLRLLDIGCGTGRFIDFVKQAWPRLPTIGLDMSEPYIKHAKRHLRRWTRTSFIIGKAEAIPVSDNSQDAVTSIFLFHELPPKVRRADLRECARVLRPGGRLVIIDSLQNGDEPDYQGLLDAFPGSYHEPYYASYTKEDFKTLAAESGLIHVRNVKAFVAKVMVFDRPAARSAGLPTDVPV